MNLGKIALAALIVAAPVSAQAAVIDFNNPDTSGFYGGNGNAFIKTTQGGYTAIVTSGSYIQSLYPGEVEFSPAVATGYYNATRIAVMTIVGPGPFVLNSFDAFSDALESDFTVSGYLGSNLVYSASGTVGVPKVYGKGTLYTTFGGFSSVGVDRVTLTTNAPYRLTLDNIMLSAAASAVPEPASWAMMIVGVGAVGGTLRTRRRRTDARVRLA